jgi:hypothetical protein
MRALQVLSRPALPETENNMSFTWSTDLFFWTHLDSLTITDKCVKFKVVKRCSSKISLSIETIQHQMTDHWWIGKYLKMKWSWPDQSTILASAWRDWGKKQKTLIRLMSWLRFEPKTSWIKAKCITSRPAHLVKPRSTWKELIKMDITKIGCEDMILTELTQPVQW